MRPIQIVIFLVALGAAGAAGLIAMNLARQPASTAAGQQAPAMALEEVLVASADVNVGGAITPDNLAWRQWPAEGLTAGVITKRQRPDAVAELQGTMVRAPIFSGEPIRDMKLVRTDRGFLSAVLPKGMRAVAVRVNAASTAGGFILPNDRVDVLLVSQNAGATRSQTLLHNVRVLAIDQTIENTGGEQQAVVVAQDTATLELTPEQAELVAQAQQAGTISLSLRSIEDSASEPEIIQKSTGVSVVRFGTRSRVSAPPSQ